MKLFLLILTLFAAKAVQASAPRMDEKILKEFSAAFPKAQDVFWTTESDQYRVRFKEGAVRCNISYDLEGNISNTVRYYDSPHLLPPMIVIQLQKKKPGTTIFGIIERSTASGISYEIILQNDNYWYHMEADGTGFVKQMRKLNKQ